MRALIIMSIIIFITACAEDNSHDLSNGLKIFVTPEQHNGDYANDSTLAGINSIEKADDFCNKSSAKPNNSTYKALLVDGIIRDPVSLTDWVLQANTKYYRPFDNVLIGQTDNAAIFPVLYVWLENSICSEFSCGDPNYGTATEVYTGIDNVSTFATTGTNCSGWSVSSTGAGSFAETTSISSSAFDYPYSTGQACGFQRSLYCVEQ